MKKNAGTSESQGSSSWMVTFSDLSTLLLTFFVLLLSMSSMDDLKLKSAFYNFTSSCGILQFKEYGEIYRPKKILIEGLYEKLKDALVVSKDEENLDEDLPSDIIESPFKEAKGSVVFQDLKDGFKLVFGQDILFDSGSAEIKEEMRPVLHQIARFIALSGYQIYVDGHTDNVPIHSEEYPSNEELSLARAYAILDHLVHWENVSPQSLAITGYGEVRPVVPNASPAGKAQNRRVEIIFKNQKYF
jgi:chemotaxis protein MotB